MAVNIAYLSAFIIYLLIILGIGVWGYQRATNLSDFWVFGRELGPGLATWSFVANFVSAIAAIGFIGSVYSDGYSILTGVIFGLLLGVSGLYFVVPKIRKMNKVTLSDILAEVTGSQKARPIAGIVLFGNAWAYLILQLVGASLLVTTVTGVPYEYMVWIIGLVFIIYTTLGGLISVTWTDLLQGTVMVAAVFLALFYMLYDLGGVVSVNNQMASIDPAYTLPLGGGALTLIGIIGSIISFFGTIFTDQEKIIRINATRDVKTAKIHIAAAGAILSVFFMGLVLLAGATTVALNTSGLAVNNVDNAYPVLITQYLPTGVGVVIILSLMSAILSTTDTRLHSCGLTFSRDIYDYFVDNASDSQLLKVSRIATVIAGLSATAIASNPPGTILEIFQFRAILVTSAFLIPVYIALYLRGINARAIFAALILGVVFGVGWSVVGEPYGVPATIMGIGGNLIGLVGGLITDPEYRRSTPAD